MNKLKTNEDIKKHIEDNKGYLFTKKLLKEKLISKSLLYKYIEDNKLTKIKNGFYKDEEIAFDDIFFEMQQKHPNLIFSYTGALYLHHLMEREPYKISFTVPYNYYHKDFENDIFEVHYASKENLKEGVVEVETMFSNKVLAYEPEKAVCELFKIKNNIDPQIFSFGWRTFIQNPQKRLWKVYDYGDKFRISKELNKLLEVLLW